MALAPPLFVKNYGIGLTTPSHLFVMLTLHSLRQELRLLHHLNMKSVLKKK
jgi:hypothetical protein